MPSTAFTQRGTTERLATSFGQKLEALKVTGIGVMCCENGSLSYPSSWEPVRVCGPTRLTCGSVKIIP